MVGLTWNFIGRTHFYPSFPHLILDCRAPPLDCVGRLIRGFGVCKFLLRSQFLHSVCFADTTTQPKVFVISKKISLLFIVYIIRFWYFGFDRELSSFIFSYRWGWKQKVERKRDLWRGGGHGGGPLLLWSSSSSPQRLHREMPPRSHFLVLQINLASVRYSPNS